MRIRREIVGVIFLACVVVLNGQEVTKVGTTAASFLNIDIGSRGVGMGSAYVSVCEDVSGVYWNPAGLARMGGMEVEFGHTRWIADIGFSHAAVGIPLGGIGGVLGLSGRFLTMDEMERTTILEPEGTGEMFSAGSYAFGLSYGRSLTDRFSIGVGVKYIHERIYHSSASGLAFDVGTLFDTQFEGLRIGMSITNYGTKMQLSGRDMLTQVDVDPSVSGNNRTINANLQTDAFDLPLLFRVGMSVDVLKGMYGSHLILSVDALHPNDDVESVNVGCEYRLGELVSLRCGYKSLFARDSEEGLTVGGGVKVKLFGGSSLVMDYAWGDFGVLDNIQKFSLKFTF